jgi:hypothetical protein
MTDLYGDTATVATEVARMVHLDSDSLARGIKRLALFSLTQPGHNAQTTSFVAAYALAGIVAEAERLHAGAGIELGYEVVDPTVDEDLLAADLGAFLRAASNGDPAGARLVHEQITFDSDARFEAWLTLLLACAGAAYGLIVDDGKGPDEGGPT